MLEEATSSGSRPLEQWCCCSKPDGEPGPRFRAPSRGYSLMQVDSDPKSTLLLRDLAVAWSQKERRVMSENKKQEKVYQPKTVGPTGRRKRRKGMCLEDRPCLEPNAAGIDIGAREIFVAVPPDRDEHPGASIRDVHPRFARDGAMAESLWHHNGGDGIDGRLLDAALRGAGSLRSEAVPDQCPAHEERSGKAHR